MAGVNHHHQQQEKHVDNSAETRDITGRQQQRGPTVFHVSVYIRNFAFVSFFFSFLFHFTALHNVLRVLLCVWLIKNTTLKITGFLNSRPFLSLNRHVSPSPSLMYVFAFQIFLSLFRPF